MRKNKSIENIIKNYNKKLNYDINHNDGLNIIHSKSSAYTYTTKSQKM